MTLLRATCSDILDKCSLSGTCCSLTDYGDDGCTLTILGGTCSPSGSSCPWSLSATSTSSDACPDGDYDVFSDPPTNAPVDDLMTDQPSNAPVMDGFSAGGNLDSRGLPLAAGFLLTAHVFVSSACACLLDF